MRTCHISDASWKGEKAADAQGGQQTGLGIYIRNNTEDQCYSLQIQATTMQTSSAFQAEARALLLAAHLTQVLGIQQPIFFFDKGIILLIKSITPGLCITRCTQPTSHHPITN